jgi:hypothetical protein
MANEQASRGQVIDSPGTDAELLGNLGGGEHGQPFAVARSQIVSRASICFGVGRLPRSS